MWRVLIRRLVGILPLLLGVSFLVFLLVELIPGDPVSAVAGETATTEQLLIARERLGLDRPFVPRYLSWLGRVIHGDLGHSLAGGQAVWTQIQQRLPVTFGLVAFALIIAVLLSVPIGIIGATRRGSLIDRVLAIVNSLWISLPGFWLAMILVTIFALRLSWFPATGYVSITSNAVDWFKHMVLPAVTLGLASSAELSRQLRSAFVDVLEKDYVRTAEAKGLGRGQVLFKHVLKNASVAPLTVLGLQAAYLLGGTVAVETVFALPGLGQLVVSAVGTRDVPVIQGVVLVAAVVVVLLNLLVDLTYRFLDPRTRTR